MALPIPLILQAIATLVPIGKASLSQKEDAKTLIKANNGPLSSSLGTILMGGGVVYGTFEEAVYGVVASLVGLGLYLYQNRSD